ncbi:TPT-domain-containing protein [Nadsonia fulvescens var. elongata DSM 6958]|uniref:TPT-domain-containing protein n=1 Tax=Nadsonia fulvescens var. elongata DSM 6958 TaxID=857566 RepID=A0A1E3PE19_9ASCO|nr:TPT-domain-containing protein [Nadsonia fulvescens var. elongata DSM 6958]
MWFLDADGTEHDYENRTREDSYDGYDFNDFNDIDVNEDDEGAHPNDNDLHYAKSMSRHAAPATMGARFRHLAINGMWILAWFFFSISLSLYNKWMFSPGKLDFHFPILTTSYHQVIQTILSLLTVLVVPSLRPQSDQLLSFKDYLIKIGPCALSSSGDIGLGNTSLLFISLTFYTMVKSSSLLFVLLFSFLFRLETPTLKLCMIIAVLTFGVILMVTGETQFDFLGFLLVLGAAMFSGLRWALTHILLLNNSSTKNPFTTILHISPIMAIVLFSMGAIVEGLGAFLRAPLFVQKGVWKGLGMITIPGVFAYCMTVAEFALLKRTSVITLSVAGILKEVLTIVYSILVFGDKLTLLNVAGLVITIASIAGYNVYRFFSVHD